MYGKNKTFWEITENAPRSCTPWTPSAVNTSPGLHIPCKVTLYLISLLPTMHKKKMKEKEKKERIKSFWGIVVRWSFGKKSFFLDIFPYRLAYLIILQNSEFLSEDAELTSLNTLETGCSLFPTHTPHFHILFVFPWCSQIEANPASLISTILYLLMALVVFCLIDWPFLYLFVM